MRNLTIDPERLWGNLMQTAAIGGTAEGRHLPAHADRSRQAGARLVPRPCRGAGLHGDRRRHGRHVRAAGGPAQPTCRRSPWAATSTPSRPAASSTARWACWARWRPCRRCMRRATRPSRRSRSSTGPTRRARGFSRAASPPACSAASTSATGRSARTDRAGVVVRRCAGSHRLRRDAALRRPPAVGLLRAAHRAGSAAGGRGQGDRHRHRHPGRALVRDDHHRPGCTYRRDAHAPAQECAARRRAPDRAGGGDRPRQCAAGGGNRRLDGGEAQLAQRRAGRGLPHRRPAPSRSCRAGQDGCGAGLGAARGVRAARARLPRQHGSGTKRRSCSTRNAWIACAPLPRRRDSRRATSSPAPATTRPTSRA